MIKEYKCERIKGMTSIITELTLDKLVIKLRDYYWFIIQYDGGGEISWNSLASETAKEFFQDIKEHDYQDFGDMYTTYKNDVYKSFLKPSKKDMPDDSEYNKENYIKYGKLRTVIHKKDFPTIINFIKENQFGYGKDPLDLYEKRKTMRDREPKLKRILKN